MWFKIYVGEVRLFSFVGKYFEVGLVWDASGVFSEVEFVILF